MQTCFWSFLPYLLRFYWDSYKENIAFFTLTISHIPYHISLRFRRHQCPWKSYEQRCWNRPDWWVWGYVCGWRICAYHTRSTRPARRSGNSGRAGNPGMLLPLMVIFITIDSTHSHQGIQGPAGEDGITGNGRKGWIIPFFIFYAKCNHTL